MTLLFLSLLYLLVIAGVGALLTTRWIPFPWLLLTLIALAGGIMADLKGKHLFHPRMNRILLLLGVLSTVLDFLWVSRHPFITVLDLMLYLISIRALSPKANRDLIQMIALAFFCLLGSAALTTDLIYGAFFLCFSFLLPWALLMVSIKAELEGERDLLRGRVAVPGALVLPPGFAQILTTGLVTRMILAIGISLLMTFLFFSLFPRFTIGQLAGKLNLTEPLVGFTPEIRLGELGKILSDPTPVARVQLPHPPKDELYLRGIALDHFDGTNWKRTVKKSHRLYSSEGRFQLLDSPLPKKEATVYLEDTGTRILFGIPWTSQITLPLHFLEVSEDEVFTAQGIFYPFRYNLEFIPEYFRPYPWENLKRLDPVPAHLKLYLDLPPRELLPVQIFAHEHEPTGKWIPEVLEEFFRYRYTLDLVPSATPLHTFFARREGHCELFATALALMLRASGIPSRIVAGFRGGEFIEDQGYYLVRQRNAHSWVEVWVEGHGWIPLDPTPPAPIPASWLARFREGVQRTLEWLRFFWLEYIVDYNLRTQKELLEGSRERVIRLKKRMSLEFQWGKLRQYARGKGIVVVAGVVFLSTLILFFFLGVRWSPFTSNLKTHPLHPLVQKLERVLGPKPPAIPLNLWVEQSTLSPELKEHFAALYEEYARIYYREASPPPQRHFTPFRPWIRSFLHKLKEERKRGRSPLGKL